MKKTIATKPGKATEHVDLTQDEIDTKQADETKTIEEEKALKFGALANERWQNEVSGITFIGSPIETDREAQGKLIAVRTLAKEDAGFTIDWKTADGWINLDAVSLISISDAVADYVGKCYAQEKFHHEAISALTDKQLVIDYDITTGFPSKTY